MKNLKILAFIMLTTFLTSNPFAQLYNPYGYTCTTVSAPELNQLLIGGQYKPESIDKYTSDGQAYFPVLIVFVQFLNDQGPDVDYWHPGQAPTFMSNIIATSKHTNTNWWDAYSETNERLSDAWMEMSRGHFHIVGQAVSVILPRTYDDPWYQNQSYGMQRINDDIYSALQLNPNINWPNYDQWSYSGGTFVYQYDGYIDMIYKVFRSHNPGIGMPAGGIACLYSSYSQGNNYLVYNQHGRQIYIRGLDGSLDYQGSGLTITPGHGGTEGQADYGRYAPIDLNGTVSFTEHEHGHYLFGYNHQCYGKMSGAGADFGLDEFLSPYEEIRMGYMTSNVVNFSNPSYSLNDYSSRNSNTQGEVLEVPINGSNEFFLIANRMGVSDYDKLMFGDTAHDNCYRVINPSYGKGLIIYHANPGSSGYPWLISIDQECADGLFNWAQDGYRYPDWSCTQQVDYYYRQSISRLNDNGGDYGISTPHDGKSIFTWFGIGQPENPRCQYGDGIDKIFTNDNEAWTSREWKGDRWDPWNVGYNEVFSPYSSPSTCDWNNNYSGIFIYLQSTNGTTANLNIYKAGQGGYTEDRILQLIPPSKPYLHPNIDIVECDNGIGHPKITWESNIEPDMLRDNGFKRYLIYRAYAPSTEIPTYYNYLDTYDDYTLASTVSYIDETGSVYCNIQVQLTGYYRYKVVAVDKYDKQSVFSDFASIQSLYMWPTHLNISDIPKTFSLYQNYPNPFNPSTIIKYDIPKTTMVTIKVYDILGRKVSTLVNEIKQPGYYQAEFNGTNLASGVYFYRINAGKFTNVKKMVLVK